MLRKGSQWVYSPPIEHTDALDRLSHEKPEEKGKEKMATVWTSHHGIFEEEKKPNIQREQVKNPIWKNVQKTKENSPRDSPFKNKLISILNKRTQT